MLSACNPKSGNVYTYFEAGPQVDTASGRLINSGTATNIQVGLLNADKSKITLGKSDGSQNVKSVTIDANGKATMTYEAQYAATAAAVGGGDVKTSVTYSIRYP